MKQKNFMLLAAVLLSSANLFAQSNEPLKGDVNGDGVVDVADITAVIDIIAKSQNDSETTYYWYVGQTDPSTMSTIDPVVTDMSSPGWRLIGTTLPDYNSSNMLWNGDQNNISFGARDYYYLALPSNSLKLYNVAGGNEMDGCTNLGTNVINNVTYYIYKRNVKAAAFAFNIY